MIVCWFYVRTKQTKGMCFTSKLVSLWVFVFHLLCLLIQNVFNCLFIISIDLKHKINSSVRRQSRPKPQLNWHQSRLVRVRFVNREELLTYSQRTVVYLWWTSWQTTSTQAWLVQRSQYEPGEMGPYYVNESWSTSIWFHRWNMCHQWCRFRSLFRFNRQSDVL